MELKIRLPIGILAVEVKGDEIEATTLIELAKQVKPFTSVGNLANSIKGGYRRIDPALKTKAIAMLKKKEKPSEIARQLGMPATTVYGIKQSMR